MARQICEDSGFNLFKLSAFLGRCAHLGGSSIAHPSMIINEPFHEYLNDKHIFDSLRKR
jgi:hypothetical protein